MNESGNWIVFFFKEKITLKHLKLLGHPSRESAFKFYKKHLHNLRTFTVKVGKETLHMCSFQITAIYTPWMHKKTACFFMFSGSIKREYCAEIAQIQSWLLLLSSSKYLMMKESVLCAVISVWLWTYLAQGYLENLHIKC